MADPKKSDAWASFFRTFNRLHQGMEEAMKEAGHPPLEIYDVLWTLERAPHQALRFSDLALRVYLSRSNITRLTERLETQGLIQRHRCPEDRRGVYAELTTTGKKMRQEMWKTYGKLIKERFTERLSETEQSKLVDLMEKLWTEKESEGLLPCGGKKNP